MKDNRLTFREQQISLTLLTRAASLAALVVVNCRRSDGEAIEPVLVAVRPDPEGSGSVQMIPLAVLLNPATGAGDFDPPSEDLNPELGGEADQPILDAAGKPIYQLERPVSIPEPTFTLAR